MYYTLQITLKSILVKENGTVEALEGLNGLSATLFYPTPDTPIRETIRKFTLEDNKEKDLTKLPFEEKLMFKQDFLGDSVLRVTLTAVEEADKFDRAMLKILSTVAPTVIGAVTGGIFTAIATGLTTSLFNLADPKDKIRVIGVGSFPITPSIEDGELPINLTVPETIKLTQLTNQDGQLVRKTITLKKGAGNARVVFDVKRLLGPVA